MCVNNLNTKSLCRDSIYFTSINALVGLNLVHQQNAHCTGNVCKRALRGQIISRGLKHVHIIKQQAYVIKQCNCMFVVKRLTQRYNEATDYLYFPMTYEAATKRSLLIW